MLLRVVEAELLCSTDRVRFFDPARLGWFSTTFACTCDMLTVTIETRGMHGFGCEDLGQVLFIIESRFLTVFGIGGWIEIGYVQSSDILIFPKPHWRHLGSTLIEKLVIFGPCSIER